MVLKYRLNEVMKHNSNPKRGRGRSGGRRPNHGPNRSYDSNGPDVKVRGTATQICDRYLALARDASSAGDRIKAEGYLQHAEHYYRVVHADDGQQVQAQGDRQGQSRLNGRRNNMGSPAELALSGEHAPIVEMSDQTQPDQVSRPGEENDSDEIGLVTKADSHELTSDNVLTEGCEAEPTEDDAL